MTETRAFSDPDAIIRAAGLRVTAPRRAVLSVLGDMPHSRADEIWDRVQREEIDTSLQSVYNVLSDFVDSGLVRKIEPAGHPGLFEVSATVRPGHDNHHHLVCTSCGRIEDVACVRGAAPCLEPSETHGFHIASAEVTFWGVCTTCAPDAPARAASASFAP